jgi:carboxypeptidase C (cathepsin A)
MTCPQLANRKRPGWPAGSLTALFLWVIVAIAPVAHGEEKPARPPSDLPARVETRHAITVAGSPLEYRAVAETISLTTQKGEPSASIFTVSYLAEAAAEKERPVAFVFNGGPGAAAVFLHLGALGPRILETPPSGAVPAPPVKLADNPTTWLAFTDLVFVDPVGTGFSRGKGKEDNPDKPFWNVEADVNSLGAVMRRWLTRYDRWASPVFLVGESYGGLRAAALSHSLTRDVGVAVSGMALVSPALDIALLHPDISNTLAPAFVLPSYAATAAAFAGKSPAEAGAAAERFALTDYLVGIAGLDGIPAPDDPFIARLADLIGIPPYVVRQERGRVSSGTFSRELRRRDGEVVSVYDATVTRPTTADPRADRAGDAVLDPAVAAFTAAFESYALNELNYRTEQPYRVLARDVSQHWNWEEARGGPGGLGLALASLQKTLLSRPGTRLFVASGRYDLVTPYLSTRWLIDQLAVPEAVRARIRLRVYEGGHMMYMRPQSRAALSADAAAIFTSPEIPSAAPPK